ncbi:hypothetical protein OROGR_005228 [Orobanche gracilis]
MSEVDTGMIVETNPVFTPLLPKLRATDGAKSTLQDLQIRIDEAKTKLQDLQNLRSEKMQEIQKAFGTLNTNLAVGCVGDDLFSGL